MTRHTAEFLLTLLNQVTLNAGAPDFGQTAMAIVNAKAELAAVLEDQERAEGEACRTR